MAKDVKKLFGEDAKKAAEGRKEVMRITVYAPDEKGESAVSVDGEATDKEMLTALILACDHFGMLCIPQDACLGIGLIHIDPEDEDETVEPDTNLSDKETESDDTDNISEAEANN